MKGVTFLNDETNKKQLVQIDMEVLKGDPETVEDLIDLLIAESRKDEEKLDRGDVKKSLLKGGKA
jgi:hypothetical protein